MIKSIILIILMTRIVMAFSQSIIPDCHLRAPWNGVYVVAHRGAHTGIPENSLASYSRAIDLGCDFVEIDIRTSKDGKFVSIHNSTVDEYVKGTKARVCDLNLSELKALDIGVQYGPQWENTRIPTFEEILELCHGRIGIYLDLKAASVSRLVESIKKYGMEKEVIWYIPASDTRDLDELRTTCPECICMPDPGTADNLKSTSERFNNCIVATDMDALSSEFVSTAHSYNIMVLTDEKEGTQTEWEKILGWKTDGIQTDRPEELIKYLKSLSVEKPLYLDPTQSFKHRVEDLLSLMTMEEKLSQMMSRIPTELRRFGIPGYQWGGEAGHCVIARSGDVATIFPQAIAQAATWSRKRVWEIADAMSDESRARVNAGIPKTGLTFWAPVVEMARDPRWGRTEECYGEDTYLTSQLSLAFVKGLQGDNPRYLKTIAAPKHFAANNEEWCRHNGSSDIDEQLLREYYLRPYQVLVQEGKAEQIMAAYNRLNEVPCVGNKWLLTDILRTEWGFDGNVVSDCNGIKDLYEGHKYVQGIEEAIALALNSGMDLECGDCFKASLAEVVRKGLVTEATIDTAVKRILISRFRLGLYDPPEMVPYTKIPHSLVDGPANRALARKSARDAIVLLKNEDKILPLDINKTTTFAVIGPNAAVCQMGGYTGAYSKAVSPLEGILSRIDSSRVRYNRGTDIKISLPAIPSSCLSPPGGKTGEHGLRGEYFRNTDFSGDPFLVRIDSSIDFNFGRGAPDPSMPVDYYSIRWTGSFVAPTSGEYFIGGDFDDAVRLYFDGKKIIDRTNNRNRSSEAVKVELTAGKHYDLKLEYTEQWYNAFVRLWGEAVNPRKFDEAEKIARNSDVVILVLGTDETVEKEGVDRSDLSLPGDQEDLARAVCRANPNTVAVLQNGSALSVNWLNNNIPAILETWYNGEEAGNALADVLFGDFNPGGRLPLTFYKSVEHFPPISDYDIRKGRTYMYANSDSTRPMADDILYPFGYGLSYTQFSYGKLHLSARKVDSDGMVTASITVKNTGNRNGDEVVQLYLHDEKASVPRPEKQLAGFERLTLKPGESRTVKFNIAAKDLSFWDIHEKAFITEPGNVRVMIGSSSADIKAEGEFEIIL